MVSGAERAFQHSLQRVKAMSSHYSEAAQKMVISEPSFLNSSVRVLDNEDVGSIPESLDHDLKGFDEKKERPPVLNAFLPQITSLKGMTLVGQTMEMSYSNVSAHSASSMTTCSTLSTLSSIESYDSYQKPVTVDEPSSAFNNSANQNDDWSKFSDVAERRRIQNRITQRNYRKKLKMRLESLERRTGPRSSRSVSPPATQYPQDQGEENSVRNLNGSHSISEERSPSPPSFTNTGSYPAPEEYGPYKVSWHEQSCYYQPSYYINGEHKYEYSHPQTPLLSHANDHSATSYEHPIPSIEKPETPRLRQGTLNRCTECRRRRQKCVPRKGLPCDNCSRRYPLVTCTYQSPTHNHTMSFDMDWTPDFCLACDKQTDGKFYCSEACRLAEYEKIERGSSRSLAKDRVSEQHSREDTLIPEQKAQSPQSQVLLCNSEHSIDVLSDTSYKQSMTETTFSGDETDEGEDASGIDSEDEKLCDYSHVKRLSRNDFDDSDCIHPLMQSAKDELINRIMREFWTIYNQEWASNIHQHGTNSPSQTTESSCGRFSGSPTRKPGGKGNKRSREDDEQEQDPDDGSWRDPKRLKYPHRLPTEQSKFSCPYRKYSPRKYSVANNWRSCALTPLESVARVKGHLYRHHRIYQCERCKGLFDSTEDVIQHRKSVQACELSLVPEAEGITECIEKRLRSRKKTHRDQSEEDRWRELYLILFPDTIVPSPYFEPIQEEPGIQSPGSEELTHYEEYARRELPRLVRSALDAIINDQTQPLEETLRAQLATIIRDCQDRVFSTYRSRSTPPKTMNGTQTSTSSNSFPSMDTSQNGSTVEELYHMPPPQDSGIDLLSFTRPLETKPKDHSNLFTDSGYGSDISSFTGGTHSSLSFTAGMDSTCAEISNLQPSQPTNGVPGDESTGTEPEINQGIPPDFWAGGTFEMPADENFDWNGFWGQNLVAESAIPATLPENA